MLKDIAVLSVSFIQLVGNSMGRYEVLFKLKGNLKEIGTPLLPELLGPMIMPQSVACRTKLIKPNLKDVSADNVHTSHSKTLDTICIITSTIFFMLDTFCPRNHSVTAWTYGTAKLFICDQAAL